MPNIKKTVLEEEFYLIFPVKGKRPEAMEEAWKRVVAYFEDESIDERRSHEGDFEKYISEEEAEIYVRVNYL